MFSYCSSLSDIKVLEKWNVSNGNNFESMFNYCSQLSDIKVFDTFQFCNAFISDNDEHL